MSDVTLPFSQWESFYVIVGSSAAALTGLQFVVMALGAESRRSSTATIDAFGTPTIVHVCAALMISASLSAPWRAIGGAALLLGVSGLAGVAYVAIVTRRARRQEGYRPVFEDWLWHAILPFVAYAALWAASVALAFGHPGSLFAIAASALLLVFIGIHNAWDSVTYIATTQLAKTDRPAAAATDQVP